MLQAEQLITGQPLQSQQVTGHLHVYPVGKELLAITVLASSTKKKILLCKSEADRVFSSTPVLSKQISLLFNFTVGSNGKLRIEGLLCAECRTEHS